MSGAQLENQEGAEAPPSADLGYGGDAAFSSLMDILAPEAGETGGSQSTDPNAPAPAGGATQPTPGEGTPAAGGAAPAQTGGAAAPAAGTPAAGSTPGALGVDGATGNAVPATGADGAPVSGSGIRGGDGGLADAGSFESNWAAVSTGLETKQVADLQQAALGEVRTEYDRYFEALEKHPRELVGQEVPSSTGEGMERLRDSNDARDWQDAIKMQLAREVKDRVSRKADDAQPMLATLHAAVELFQKNSDLVPNTRQFDKELADKFVQDAKPYEILRDGKIIGYSVPVQPMVDSIRAGLKAVRALQTPATPPAAAGQTPQQLRAAEQARAATGQFTNPGDSPQAGILGKAGNSSDSEEDFSTLFGTIGLPNFRI